MKKDKKRARTVEITPLEGGGGGAPDADGAGDVAGTRPESPAEVLPEPQAEPDLDPSAPDEMFEAVEETTEVSGPSEAELFGPMGDEAMGEEETVEASAGEGAPAGGTPGEGVPGDGEAAEPPVDSAGRLESIIESLLFASDRPLGIADLKRLVNERDAKKLGVALERLQERHRETGIQLATAGGGWQFRTHPENASWVAKLMAGRPARLSRAMLETLAIVAYRQPITRPEIDEIRGVDCGPVLKTLLDRALVRMIGKKEEVGRPILYGTTPEFLRTFSLKDLTQLPTLREFHELGVAEMAKVDAEAPTTSAAREAGAAAPTAPRAMPSPTELPEHDPDEEDALLEALDEATSAAARAAKPADPPAAASPEPPAPEVSE